MSAHKIDFTVPERPLGNVDVEFKVQRDGQMLGRLRISKGNIHWVPKNAKFGFKLNWHEFDALIKERGTHEKG